MRSTAHEEAMLRIIRSEHHDPFEVLGAHFVEVDDSQVIAIRAFLPGSSRVEVLVADDSKPAPMNRLHPEGFYEATLVGRTDIPRYRLRLTDEQGITRDVHDPYSFLPVLTDFDLHLFGEGTFYEVYEKLGAHCMRLGDVPGVLFAIWAPNALRVSVVGDFNQWDGRRHPMRSRSANGIWELFIPELVIGEHYKFEIKSRFNDYIVLKSDPFAFRSELRPKTASVVAEINHFAWNDSDWLAERERRNGLGSPISIYEIHLGSWRRCPEEGARWLTYHELAESLTDYVKDMGFTHIELLPVTEHPFDGSWGYQTTGYFAATSRFGSPQDFQYLVDACHRKGIGVILDWVPSHFPMDEHGLRYFDGTFLYEHEDPRLGFHQDWGTAIFNFGRTEVRNFLISNALFWLEKYHLDGLRVDAVASMLYLDYSRNPGEWIPNAYGGNENLDAIAFIKDFNAIVHRKHPNVLTIAEESTAWPGVSRPVHLGGLGFSLKWNMGWMHDMLEYFSTDPIYRKYHHNKLTFALMYAFTENFVLVLSHDEVVHMKRSLLEKMPGDSWQKFANLRALYALMYSFPGKKLLFMGAEIGQPEEWNHDTSLSWHLLQIESHRKLQECLRSLNRVYTGNRALYDEDFHHSGFEWIDFSDSDNSVISFIRKSRDSRERVIVVGNFTPVPRIGYRMGVPESGFYHEIFNSDSEAFGGGNLGNLGRVEAEPIPCHGRSFSISLTLPPLGALYLVPEAGVARKS